MHALALCIPRGAGALFAQCAVGRLADILDTGWIVRLLRHDKDACRRREIKADRRLDDTKILGSKKADERD
jgi:hypothetical protein